MYTGNQVRDTGFVIIAPDLPGITRMEKLVEFIHDTIVRDGFIIACHASCNGFFQWRGNRLSGFLRRQSSQWEQFTAVPERGVCPPQGSFKVRRASQRQQERIVLPAYGLAGV